MRVKIGYKAFRALIIAFDRQDVQRLKKNPAELMSRQTTRKKVDTIKIQRLL